MRRFEIGSDMYYLSSGHTSLTAKAPGIAHCGQNPKEFGDC